MRSRARTTCILILTLMAIDLHVSAQAESLNLKTEQGAIHGKLINDGKVRAFLGMPYAAIPVGDLRWKAPMPPAKWKGVREATKYGARCMQDPSFDMVFQDDGQNEDCLYLNVFAPANAKRRQQASCHVLDSWRRIQQRSKF